jgi:hypothetical protein
MIDLAWLECVMVKNVRFSMAGKCHGVKRQIDHGQNVHGQTCLIPHGWPVLLPKTSYSAWLCSVMIKIVQFSMVVVKNVRFSMAGLCYGHIIF